MANSGVNTIDENLFQKSLDFAASKLKLSGNFKPQQRHAVQSVLEGRDLFVNLPTGFGKSVVFQAVPLCRNFITEQLSTCTCTPNVTSSLTDEEPYAGRAAVSVVISPLVSLMQDQTNSSEYLGNSGRVHG